MRQLLQDALPKKAASVYGAGTAGDVWRGLFAEQLAHALAGSGRLGVGARLVKTGAPA
ncbi:MAG: rod-binding protein [Rhodoblastus sp.]|nr:MAG: rod-binding protein [Rhodoblastus sp.]